MCINILTTTRYYYRTIYKIIYYGELYWCMLRHGALCILVNKTEISASKKWGSGWDRIRVNLSTTLVY